MEESCCKRSLSWCKKKNSFINLLDEFQFIARDRFEELVVETGGGGGRRGSGQILAKNMHEKLADFLAELPQIFFMDTVHVSMLYTYRDMQSC